MIASLEIKAASQESMGRTIEPTSSRLALRDIFPHRIPTFPKMLGNGHLYKPDSYVNERRYLLASIKWQKCKLGLFVAIWSTSGVEESSSVILFLCLFIHMY